MLKTDVKVQAETGFADIDQFPESYREALLEIKQLHPDWTFEKLDTGLDWDTAVGEEMHYGRSLVPVSKGSNWGTTLYGQSWNVASQDAVEYCLDPRNYLDESHIFAFEKLTFDSNVHTVPGTQAVIANSFMSGAMPLSDMTYAECFYLVGQSLDVSPYHLASRALLEQGRNGRSPLISGTYTGYEGYYNYYNISAYGDNDEIVVQNGLARAKAEGWTSPYLSIEGGAGVIAGSYILKGQDTLYLEKFDVDSSYYGICYHQYMQNILAPFSESVISYNGYQSEDALDIPFCFKIPVYRNMPATACLDPDVKAKLNEIVVTQGMTDYVTRLYRLVLEREPDEEGLEHWTNSLAQGVYTGSDVAVGFFMSDEMTGRNLSDEDYVETCYLTLLGRESDEEGKANWLDKLENGMSRRYIVYGFGASPEFAGICEEYGILQGSVELTEYRDRNYGITSFVARCYTKALGRTYDVDGLNHWCQTILEADDAREMARHVASESFFHSQEFTERETDDDAYVRILYSTFFDREPDEEGYNHWMGLLESGGADRDEVLRRFADSAEFDGLLDSFGL